VAQNFDKLQLCMICMQQAPRIVVMYVTCTPQVMTLQLCRCSLEEGDLEKGVLGWEQTCYSIDCRVAC
jgi:hypothetical protein